MAEGLKTDLSKDTAQEALHQKEIDELKELQGALIKMADSHDMSDPDLQAQLRKLLEAATAQTTEKYPLANKLLLEADSSLVSDEIKISEE